jgi:hypothetical protein
LAIPTINLRSTHAKVSDDFRNWPNRDMPAI